MVDLFNSELRYLFDPASRHIPFHILLTFVSPPRVCSDLGSQGLEELLFVFYQHVFTLMFSLWNVDGTQMFLNLPNLKHQSFDQLWIPVHSFVCMLKVILVETAFDDILVLRLLRPDSAKLVHKPSQTDCVSQRLPAEARICREHSSNSRS